MRSFSKLLLSLLLIISLVAARAEAGPDWDEMANGGGDAGSMVASAQPVVGAGALNSLTGRLSNPPSIGPGGGDFEDMYLFRIVDPLGFSATTVFPPGFADFDTMLFLFNPDGTGLLGNDDAFTGTLQSTIAPPGDDGTMIPGPGDYLLAISGFQNVPLSVTGSIFDFSLPFEVSGPDGPGGFDPLSGWSAQGDTGDYVIILEGAEFIPEPTSLALLAFVGLATAGCRRSRFRRPSRVAS
ncbi:MAG: DVUA0089 family protein [Planctomycetota bacterium]|nr:DVUA0089 family protein [Planctomycetota bacterium]